MNVTQDLPIPQTQWVDAVGRLTPTAYNFLLTLWRRTGSGPGSLVDDALTLAVALSGEPIQDQTVSYPPALAADPVDSGSAVIQFYPDPTDLSAFFIPAIPPDVATQPAPYLTLTVGASPWTYTSVIPGAVLLKSGTVSDVTLTRGGTSISTGQTAGFFPMGRGDLVTVTYTVAPTVYFIPG